MGVGAKYVPLSPDMSLAVLSDISKLDCTGQKVDNHSCVWAHFKVEEPCNSVLIAIFCNLLVEFVLNRYKKSQNRPNLDIFVLLKFYLSFLKY